MNTFIIILGVYILGIIITAFIVGANSRDKHKNLDSVDKWMIALWPITFMAIFIFLIVYIPFKFGVFLSTKEENDSFKEFLGKY
jgi:Na+/H+-dicarboxylate symporter